MTSTDRDSLAAFLSAAAAAAAAVQALLDRTRESLTQGNAEALDACVREQQTLLQALAHRLEAQQPLLQAAGLANDPDGMRKLLGLYQHPFVTW